MGYDTASSADVPSVIDGDDGDMWFLKDALDADHLGVSILELDPGSAGVEHDESESGQEEVYVCVAGEATFEVGGDTVVLSRHDALRVDATEERQVFNHDDERVELVIVGAPTSAN